MSVPHQIKLLASRFQCIFAFRHPSPHSPTTKQFRAFTYSTLTPERPRNMKALVLAPATRSVSVRDLPIPEPAEGEVLIRVHAVALNPVDSFYASFPIAQQEQRVVGTDFAGIVEGVAPDLANSSDLRTKIGTRVSGFHQGACSSNDRPGAFAEYITAPYDLLWNVPESLSLEEASAISMCGLTAAQGVFERLGLPCPFDSTTSASQGQPASNDVTNVFIYGASTSLGLYAAQLVRLAARTSGRKIRLIGAASPSRHGFLQQKPYEYDVLVDYRDPQWIDKVKEATDGKGIDRAIDSISEGVTVSNVHSTLGADAKMAIFRGPAGGKFDVSNLRIKPIYGAVWIGLGHEIGYNSVTIPANPGAREFATKFFSYLSTAATDGKVKLEPNPLRLMPGGLERIVEDGFALLGSNAVTERSGTGRTEDYMRPVSAEKMVYRIA